MKHPLIGVVPLLLVSEHAFALAKAFTLPELVQMSSIIARVEVLSTQEVNREEHQRYRSVAAVKVLEVFRGASKTELMRLRFDNGNGCPNVHYSTGEECLVFASRDIDGTYSTVNYEFGKKRIDTKNYASIVTRIKTLSAKYAFEVSMSTIATTQQTQQLQITVKNKGEERILIANDLQADMRDPNVQERGLGPQSSLPVTVVFQSTGTTKPIIERPRSDDALRPLVLFESEACTATIPVENLFFPWGRATLKVWAKVGGRLSDPVAVTADFGPADKRRVLRRTARTVPPFTKVSESK